MNFEGTEILRLQYFLFDHSGEEGIHYFITAIWSISPVPRLTFIVTPFWGVLITVGNCFWFWRPISLTDASFVGRGRSTFLIPSHVVSSDTTGSGCLTAGLWGKRQLFSSFLTLLQWGRSRLSYYYKVAVQGLASHMDSIDCWEFEVFITALPG